MSNTADSITGISRATRLAFAAHLIPALLSPLACVVGVRPAYVGAGPPPGELVVNEAPPALPAELVTVAPALDWSGWVATGDGTAAATPGCPGPGSALLEQERWGLAGTGLVAQAAAMYLSGADGDSLAAEVNLSGLRGNPWADRFFEAQD